MKKEQTGAGETVGSSKEEDTTEGSLEQKKKGRKRSRQLEDQLWFHGTLSRQDAALLLEKDGDFLVRTTMKDQPEMVLSLRCRGFGVQHILVSRDGKGWRFEDKTCHTMFELISHHFRTKTSVRKNWDWILKRGVKRDEWMISHRCLKEEELIGDGAFGEVYKGKVKRGEEWVPAAIKRYKGAMSDTERDFFLQEAKLMKAYTHPNVVTLYGVAVSRPPIRMILEFCENGSLNSYFKNHAAQIHLMDRLKMCLDAAKGMEYLEEKGCVHRDLAARNCLLGADLEVKISDFGMSREGKSLEEGTTVKIPVRWAAPETLTQNQWNHATDAYSFGIVIWEIFTDCQIPWTELPDNKSVALAVLSGRKLEFPQGTPHEIVEIAENCWEPDPSKRCNFRSIRIPIQHLIEIRLPTPTRVSPESCDDYAPLIP